MVEKRNISREDLLLKGRLGAEGYQLQVKQPPPQATSGNMVLDGCDMVVPFFGLQANPLSPLEAVLDGNDVTISEKGERLVTGKLEPRAPWRDKRLADGTLVDQRLECLGTGFVRRPQQLFQPLLMDFCKQFTVNISDFQQ